MSFLSESIIKCEELRSTLPSLRASGRVEDLILYYERMLEIADRQATIYTRLRLIGDKDSTQVADEMLHAAEQLWGKHAAVDMIEFIGMMKEEVQMHIWALKGKG